MKPIQLIVCLILPVASAFAVAEVQPFASTIQSLARASSDLVTVQKNADQDVQREAVQLQAKVSALIFESLFVPVKIFDQKLKVIGFELRIDPADANSQYAVRENENRAALTANTFSFKADQWKDVSAMVDKGVKDVRTVMELTTQSQATMSRSDVDQIAKIASTSRIEALARLKAMAERAIECIDYFSKSLSESGMVPVVVGDKSYAWSSDDLRRVYGVDQTDQLSSDQRGKAASRLQEMVSKVSNWGATKYGYTCISFEKYKFMKSEIQRLGAN